MGGTLSEVAGEVDTTALEEVMAVGVVSAVDSVVALAVEERLVAEALLGGGR